MQHFLKAQGYEKAPCLRGLIIVVATDDLILDAAN
jgi:hypothetical protein